jgi:two-component system, chemotaxis family, chemotaxis protein CheY
MAFNVLIVDDSPAMRSFVGRVLELSGFALGQRLEASGGEEALRLLGEHWVDLVLTDLNMPGMGGEQFVRRMEQDEVLRSIPVVVISTDSTASRIDRLMGLGARGYVKKPFLPETLRQELEHVLGEPHDCD